MGFVFNEVALGQFSFHHLLHIHLSSGDGAVRQLVVDVPSGLSLTPPHPTKLKKKKLLMLHIQKVPD
jgi:hypothetical protein